MQYSRFAAWAVYWHGSAGQPPLPRLRVEAAAVPVSRLSGLVLHVCDESAATTVQLVDSFMPLAAPLVSGDCAPPALEVHDGSLRQHSTHFLARLLFPGGQFPSVREATHRPCPRRRRGARNVIPTPGSPPCITRRCATLRSSSVWLHGCDEGPARHLRVGPTLWAVRGRPPRRGDRVQGTSWSAVGDLVPAKLGLISSPPRGYPSRTSAVAARIAEMSTCCRFVWMWDIVLVTATTAPRDAVRESGTRFASDGRDRSWTRGCWLS